MKFEQIEHYDHFDTETIFWADITDMPETIQNKAREIDGAGYNPLRFGVVRTVYMYLKDHADGEGKCWPGIRTISSELRLSRSTVKRALDDLCKAELISKEHRWRENGSLSSNLYRLK